MVRKNQIEAQVREVEMRSDNGAGGGARLSYGHCFCCPHPAIATVAIHYFFILGMGY